MSHKLILTTCPQEEAETLVRSLLERRVIACANLLYGARSHYWWDGVLETAQETVMLLKTTEDRAEEAIAAIRELHSYDVPEVIVVPIEGGNPEYLGWLTAETAPDELR